MSENWKNLVEDGGVKKHIIRKGNGRNPFIGEKVSVLFSAKNEKNKTFKESPISGKTYDFVIGEEEDTKGWMISILSMRSGEESEFEVAPEYGYGDKGFADKVSAGEKIFYSIEFKFILEPMPKEKAILEAETLNKAAGDAFKKGNYELAKERYCRAKAAISMHCDDYLISLMNKLNSNLATSYSKLGNWKECLACAETVLRTDGSNQKCLMRKIDALIKLKDVEAANKFIAHILKVTNNEPAFLAKKKEIEKLSKDIKNSQSSAYSRLAGKKLF